MDSNTSQQNRQQPPSSKPKLNFADFSDPNKKPQNSNQDGQRQPVIQKVSSNSPMPQQRPQRPDQDFIDAGTGESSSQGQNYQFKEVRRNGSSNFYIPGKTPGQPWRENQFRYCYNITKRFGKKYNWAGDKFDYFLYQADKKINYYESKILDSNPYNPFKLEANFNVNVVSDDQYEKIKKSLKDLYGIKVDDMIAVEGCLNDDKTVLGGKHEFLSHFCTLFNFDICFSAKEMRAIKGTQDMMNDNDAINRKIEDFIKKFDDIK